MKWFGGFSGRSPAQAVPVDSAVVWPDTPGVWRVGGWSKRDVKTAAADTRRIAILGSCGVPSDVLSRMAKNGLPDDVTWRWPGTFAAVEQDGGGTQTVFTDPSAALPIYVVHVQEGVVWASSSRALSVLVGGRVDVERLRFELQLDVGNAERDGTFFSGVRQLPPGARVTFQDGRIDVETVWSPRPVDDDPVLRLRSVVINAVEARSSGLMTSDLSGGADSSALTVAAAQASPSGVIAFTLRPAGIMAGGDLDYADLVARSSPRIRHVMVPLTQAHLPYSELESLPATDEPAPSTIAYAQFRHQMMAVGAAGSDAHLTGDGGDSIFRTPDEHLADLARAFQVRRLLREATALGRLRRVAPRQLITHAIKSSRLAIRGGVALLAESDLATNATIAEVRHVARTARADIQLAEHLGVDLHNPLLDPAIVNSVAITGLARRAGRQAYKPHLYAAVRPWLPTAVGDRTNKGIFQVDFYAGLRRNLPSIVRLLNGRLADLGLVEPSMFEQELRRAAAGLATVRIDRFISAESWLRAIDQARPIMWRRELVQAS